MALSDSMFLFDLLVVDLKSYKSIHEFAVTAKFADIFKTDFDKPIINSAFKKTKQIRSRETCKVRNIKSTTKRRPNINNPNVKSILVRETTSHLQFMMKTNPLEIFVFSKSNSDCKLGFTSITWSKSFCNYLRYINKNPDLPPAYFRGTYNIYDEVILKRIAIIDVAVKLTFISKNNENDFKYLLQNNSIPATFNKINLESTKEEQILSNIKIDTGNVLTKPIKKIEPAETKIIGLDLSTKSDTNIVYKIQNNIQKSLACSSNKYGQNNILHYIFENPSGTFGDRVYCVGYFTVEKDVSDPNSVKSPEGSKSPKSKITLNTEEKHNASQSTFSSKFSQSMDHIDVIKCNEVSCEEREHRKLPLPPDDRILLDILNINRECCKNIEKPSKIEEIFGEMKTEMKIGEDPCFCTCECTFGFTKKTTYCDICGGYEVPGDELSRKAGHEMLTPCPFYHKLVDKNKLKTVSTSGSESKNVKLKQTSSQKAGISDKRSTADKKSVESEKDSKKGKKQKKDDRFRFNYGYKGIPPQIGHSKCALPCTGTLGNVPKRMGWLWTADNVPGMKFRPLWKPGATSKHVVRLLKIARNPGEMMSKRKRKDTGKKKRPLKRPLLVVHKKDGEYTVTMETMKNYSKPRALNQHPYEDKPVVTYTIGRTEEENRERLKKKERERRRLERAQRHFIQNTFRDMCHEICLKTYQQALGILPDTEDPECLCYPALPGPETTNMNVSCSCSEDENSFGSDTDSDEWIVEFTPPNATFDPTYKGKKVIKADYGTQYSYLDYKVKLLDRFGNPVPRFFKGPDGKIECSDLGGFWSPDRKWLEINVDGYIAPDNRWAPNIFIGPNGENVDAEAGKFQATNGNWLIVGVDGYIDSQNKWKYYSKQLSPVKRKHPISREVKKVMDKKYAKSENSWSCFGDASPKHLSKLGIVGHGGDRKLLISALEDMLAHGEDVQIPQPKSVYHPLSSRKKRISRKETSHDDRSKCRHPVPSSKGVIAVDAYGNKTYFRLKKTINKRPKDRLTSLTDQGISLSSFHVPCFNSFINSEIMKQENRKRLIALASKNISTQIS